MTEMPPPEERDPISHEQVDAEIDEAVEAGMPVTLPADMVWPVRTLRSFTMDRRAFIAASIAVACFSVAVLVAIVSQYLTANTQRDTIHAQVQVIDSQGKTIDVERSRSQQIERQASDLQSQVSDQQNQALCRAQIANDYESLRSRLERLVSHRDQLFRESLSVALAGDRDGFQEKLDEANMLDPQINDLEPQVDAAVQARQESVATCQKASTTTTTTTPGG